MGSYFFSSQQNDESEEQSEQDYITPMHSNNNNKNDMNNNNFYNIPNTSKSQVFLGEKHKRQNQSDMHEEQNNSDNRNKVRKIDLDPQRMILSQHNMGQIQFSEIMKENKKLKEENEKNKKLIEKYNKKLEQIESEVQIKVTDALTKMNDEKNKNDTQIRNIIKNAMKDYQKENEEKLNLFMKEIPEKMESDFKQKAQELEKLYHNIYKKSQESNKSNNNTVHLGIKCQRCFINPIIGIRYKCTECDNYNLCEKCEKENSETNEHPHLFIKYNKKEEPQKKEKNNNKININNFESNKINNFIENNNKKSNNDSNNNSNNNIINNNNNNSNNNSNNNINNISNNNSNNNSNINNNTNNNSNNIKNNKYNNNNIIKSSPFIDKNQNQNQNINNSNIIESHIRFDKKTDFDNYSYICLTKELSFGAYQGTKQERFNIILKNDGIFPWPKNNTFLLKDNSLSDNISVDKIFLEPLNPNDECIVSIYFNNMEKLSPGKYSVYFKFNANNKNFGDEIKIEIEILDKNGNYKLNRKVAAFRSVYNIDDETMNDEMIQNALEANGDNFENAFQSLFQN